MNKEVGGEAENNLATQSQILHALALKLVRDAPIECSPAHIFGARAGATARRLFFLAGSFTNFRLWKPPGRIAAAAMPATQTFSQRW